MKSPSASLSDTTQRGQKPVTPGVATRPPHAGNCSTRRCQNALPRKANRPLPWLSAITGTVALALAASSGPVRAEWKLETVHSFQHTNPFADTLTVASDGSVYGTTGTPGYYIFRINPQGAVSYIANANDYFFHPFLEGPDGNLYSVRTSGTYRLTPGGVLTRIVEFDYDEVGWPDTAHSIDAAGNIYFASEVYGDQTVCKIFRVTPDGTLSELAAIPESAGYGYVQASFVNTDGRVYLAFANWSADENTLVRVNTNGGQVEVVAADTPRWDRLLKGPNGSIYAFALRSSTVWKIELNGTYDDVANFPSDSIRAAAATPQGGLLVATTSFDFGEVFRISGDGQILSWGNTNERIMSLAASGTGLPFFGTASKAPVSGGLVKRIDSQGAAASAPTLLTFPYQSNGFRPIGPLVAGTDGNLYGITRSGGSENRGVFFRVSPGGTYTKIRDFTWQGTGVAWPTSGLALGPDGAFYFGGFAWDAHIFRITAAGVVTIANINISYGPGEDYNFTRLFSFGGSLRGITANWSSPSPQVMHLPVGGSATTVFALPQGYEYSSNFALAPDGSLAMVVYDYWGSGDAELRRYSGSGSLLGSLAPSDEGGNWFGRLVFANDGRLFGVLSSEDENYDVTWRFFNISPQGVFAEVPLAQEMEGLDLFLFHAGQFLAGDYNGLLHLTPEGNVTRLVNWTSAESSIYADIYFDSWSVAGSGYLGLDSSSTSYPSGAILRLSSDPINPAPHPVTPVPPQIANPVPLPNTATPRPDTPKLAESSKRIVTNRRVHRIRGDAGDLPRGSKVEFRVGSGKTLTRNINRQGKFVVPANLEPGVNVVRMRTVTPDGQASRWVRVRIVRE